MTWLEEQKELLPRRKKRRRGDGIFSFFFSFLSIIPVMQTELDRVSRVVLVWHFSRCSLPWDSKEEGEEERKIFQKFSSDRWVRLLALRQCSRCVPTSQGGNKRTTKEKAKETDGVLKKCGRMWWWHWAARSLSSKWKVWSSCAPSLSTLSFSASAPGNTHTTTQNAFPNPWSRNNTEKSPTSFLAEGAPGRMGLYGQEPVYACRTGSRSKIGCVS